MQIRAFERTDIARASEIWQACYDRGETVLAPLDPHAFEDKFLIRAEYDPACFLAVEEEGRLIGFAHGVIKKLLLADETPENTPGYLTAIFVDPACRKRGVGGALLAALESAFCGAGKRCSAISSGNTVQLSWLVPGTPGHDHNNAPGLDLDCPAYDFFAKRGYLEHFREIAMYINLQDYRFPETIREKQAELMAQGFETGRYDPHRGCEFDEMCDRVGSEYWRAVLREETAAHLENRPCTDVRFCADGRIPAGPRPILAAVHDGHIVGFTGPVDLQKSGRGWFSGICTDPKYGGKGIASVLFNLLLKEFVDEGAAFATLFTGESNHAQRIYLHAGMKPVRRFCIMEKPLIEGGGYFQTHF